MIKHTPGKWEIERPFDFELTIVEAGKQAYEWKFIATIPLPEKDDGNASFPRNTCHANARLIAAAPDQNAAAKELDRWALVIESAVREDQRHHLESIVNALLANRAAIAKAEGGNVR